MMNLDKVDELGIVARFIRYTGTKGVVQTQNGRIFITKVSEESEHLQKGDIFQLNYNTYEVLGRTGDFIAESVMSKKLWLEIFDSDRSARNYFAKKMGLKQHKLRGGTPISSDVLKKIESESFWS